MSEDGAKAAPDLELALGVTLLALAGYVDAVAFLRLNGLFVSFASGDSTRLAALPSEGRLGEAAAAGGVVALFVMGAFAGRLITLATGALARAALLSVVAALLALAVVISGTIRGGAAMALTAAAMALAMGLQNSVLHCAGPVRVTPTYVTGALVKLAHELADAVQGAPSLWGSYLLMWLGLVAGAALGALGAQRLGSLALLPPAVAAALLALGLGGLVRRRSAGGRPS